MAVNAKFIYVLFTFFSEQFSGALAYKQLLRMEHLYKMWLTIVHEKNKVKIRVKFFSISVSLGIKKYKIQVEEEGFEIGFESFKIKEPLFNGSF